MEFFWAAWGKLMNLFSNALSLSHEKEYFIAQKYYIRSSCEYKGGIFTVWNQGFKLMSLFHPNLIPNLEKMKISIPRI
jgi:hypothetical protein